MISVARTGALLLALSLPTIGVVGARANGPEPTEQQVQPTAMSVREAQRVLQEAGYYRGEIDGIAGPLTRQALRDFQRDRGMTVTGQMDSVTVAGLQQLRTEQIAAAEAARREPVTNNNNNDREITMMSVREAQRVLRDAGYYDGAIDGIKGPQTQTALREFQLDRGMSVTGELDTETRAGLWQLRSEQMARAEAARRQAVTPATNNETVARTEQPAPPAREQTGILDEVRAAGREIGIGATEVYTEVIEPAAEPVAEAGQEIAGAGQEADRVVIAPAEEATQEAVREPVRVVENEGQWGLGDEFRAIGSDLADLFAGNDEPAAG
ncbi:MAG: peptidoglycan-binding domain-containing protein [Bryobacteraceae bacterium]